jgi:Putative phage serine protease XkdF
VRKAAAAVAFADVDDDELDDLDDEGITELGEFDPERLDGVDFPASGLPFLLTKRAEKAGGRATAGVLRPVPARLVKSAPERRYTLVVAYPVNRPDVSVAADGQRDFAGPAALETAAWSFLSKGGQIGLFHANGTTGAGTCVESYIWRGDPWTVKAADGSSQTVVPGDWCVGIIWDEPTWELVKSGKIRGVSMQGTAMRRKPSKEALAQLRKQRATEVCLTTLEKTTAPVLAQLGDLGERIKTMEKTRLPRCGRCQKRARTTDAKFCTRCGHRFGAVAKGLVDTGDLERMARVIRKAHSADPEERDPALGRLMELLGPAGVMKVISGEPLSARDLSGFLVKAAAEEEDGASRCRTCEGRGRLRHPVSGKASTVCPSCHGTGEQPSDDAEMTEDEEFHLAAVLQRAMAKDGSQVPAIGELAGLVGPDMVTRILTGDTVSPTAFTRAYLANGRARQSGAGGRVPRVPQATHVVRASDFQRPPLPPPQSRPAPGSVWPGMGGQQAAYGTSPGAAEGLDWIRLSSSMIAPGLAASTGM